MFTRRLVLLSLVFLISGCNSAARCVLKNWCNEGIEYQVGCKDKKGKTTWCKPRRCEPKEVVCLDDLVKPGEDCIVRICKDKKWKKQPQDCKIDRKEKRPTYIQCHPGGNVKVDKGTPS